MADCAPYTADVMWAYPYSDESKGMPILFNHPINGYALRAHMRTALRKNGDEKGGAAMQGDEGGQGDAGSDPEVAEVLPDSDGEGQGAAACTAAAGAAEAGTPGEGEAVPGEKGGKKRGAAAWEVGEGGERRRKAARGVQPEGEPAWEGELAEEGEPAREGEAEGV